MPLIHIIEVDAQDQGVDVSGFEFAPDKGDERVDLIRPWRRNAESPHRVRIGGLRVSNQKANCQQQRTGNFFHKIDFYKYTRLIASDHSTVPLSYIRTVPLSVVGVVTGHLINQIGW